MKYHDLLMRCLRIAYKHPDIDQAMVWFSRADKLVRMARKA